MTDPTVNDTHPNSDDAGAETAQPVSADVRAEVTDRIGVITLDRPKALNALTFDIADGLARIWREWEASGDVDVIVLRATGEKAFAAGADIGELTEKTPAQMLREGMQHAFRRIRTSAIPSIAAVQGLALGGGFELALSCDIRIATPKARFGLPETGLGIIPGAGGTQMLARYAGISVANYHILTGEPMTAERAYQLGLVSRIVEADQLHDVALELARTVQQRGPLASRLAKLAVRASADTSFESGLDVELLAQAALFGTPQPGIGLNAFLAREQPNFVGGSEPPASDPRPAAPDPGRA